MTNQANIEIRWRHSALGKHPTLVASFIAKLSSYVMQPDFDGLDIDLEGPAIGCNYGAFVKELARALRSQGKLLAAALSQGCGGKHSRRPYVR